MSYTVILYTDNTLPEQFFRFCLNQLHTAAWHNKDHDPAPPDCRCVSSEPIELPPGWVNIVENSCPRGLENCYRKILAGLDGAAYDVVFLAEHDVLYPPGYFSFDLPVTPGWFYNVNLWVHNQYGFFPRSRMLTSQLCADRYLLEKIFTQRVEWCLQGRRIVWDEPGGNPGEFAQMIPWRSEVPAIDIRHGHNLTGMRESPEYAPELAGWGTHNDLWTQYGV